MVNYLVVGMNGAVSYSTNAISWSDVYSQDHRVWLYDVILLVTDMLQFGVGGGDRWGSTNLRDWQTSYNKYKIMVNQY